MKEDAFASYSAPPYAGALFLKERAKHLKC